MKFNFYSRLLSVLALSLLGSPAIWAQSQTGPAFYSNTGKSDFDGSCLLFSCATISDELKAVDADFNTFATLRTPLLSLGTTSATLRMTLSDKVPKNYRAGVVISTTTGLTALGTITLRTYLTGKPSSQQSLDVTSLAGLALGSTTPGRVEFLATEPFDQIEIEVRSLISIASEIRVHYAYGVDANVVETARGVASRFSAPVNGTNYSTAVVDNNVTVCVNSGVSNPEFAADQSLTNFATFGSLVGVSCPNTLRVKLEAPAPAGYQAGFVVGQQGLLDLNVLSGLRLTTFKNGVQQETAIGGELLRVVVLPDGKQHVSFETTKDFDEVQLSRSSLVSGLDNLRVYYGFGLEPSVFRDQTPILSDFSSGAGQFDVSSDGFICALCANVNVLNPERAADNNTTDANDYAEFRTGLLGVANSSALRLNLNGTGVAGNAAGVVLNQATGLLNTQLLSGITLRTYGGPTGNQLLETASGANLLQLGLLPDGRSEVFFRTTQDFQRVEIEISNTVSLLDRTRIYYAFAQDRPTGFPTTITPPAAPLPVELRVFQAKLVNEAVDVTWQTASERNNRHFVVERARQPKDGFVAIGQVEGAGTSASSRSYSFRDQTAAASGASTLYYRLRQVDADGKESFSPVAVVALDKLQASTLTVYPNPAATSAEVQVELPNLETAAATTLAVYDMRGTLLHQIPVTGSVLKLGASNLPAGFYHVVLLGMQGQRLGAQRLVVTGR